MLLYLLFVSLIINHLSFWTLTVTNYEVLRCQPVYKLPSQPATFSQNADGRHKTLGSKMKSSLLFTEITGTEYQQFCLDSLKPTSYSMTQKDLMMPGYYIVFHYRRGTLSLRNLEIIMGNKIAYAVILRRNSVCITLYSKQPVLGLEGDTTSVSQCCLLYKYS